MALSNKVKALLFSIIFLIMGLSMGSTVVDTVQGVNTTGWTFTGYEAVESLIDLFPLLYYASIVLGFMAMVFVISTKVN